MNRRLIILGSTGSIGTQALDVVAHLNTMHRDGTYPDSYQIVGLAAGSNAMLLNEQARAFDCRSTALAVAPPGTAATFTGQGAAEKLVRQTDCDLVLAAMVGSAGLPATLAAISLGRDVALANKETLVAAGELVVREAFRSGSRLLPVDSEHAGLWHCLQSLESPDGRPSVPPLRHAPAVHRVVLTASGGPFRTWTKERIDNATPKEALNHPTWSMGPKVTVDSASLMNKALEIVEAHWLFNLEPSRIQALVHPQSTVHAIAEFVDGSMVAQLSAPDMRHPIQQALSWPLRAAPRSGRLDLSRMSSLEFHPPDLERFPSLGFAYRALEAGGTSGAVLNAANEAAVLRFLSSSGASHPMAFGLIPRLVGEAMDALGAEPASTLPEVLRADARAREFVEKRLEQLLSARVFRI